MKPVEERLRETIGLDAASVGSNMIQRAVRQRMRTLGLKRPADYLQRLEHSPREWQELVESVVVTETWFFRDPDLLAAFVRLVREEWLPAHPTTPLRVLSVPCASGEEPFSLVIALRDAGVPADRLRIEAVDISARALAQAARGVYGSNAFRSKDLTFRDRYFQPSAQGFVLDPAVRACVRFCQGNFLSDDCLTDRPAYDFVFCRNLLIYLDPVMRRKALDKLDRLLAPAGIIFLSPVEQPLAIQHGFAMAAVPMASACCKPGHGPRPQRPPGPPKRSDPTPNKPLLDGELRPQPLTGPKELPPPLAAPSPSSDLEAARRLADAGRLNQAAQICETHLRQNPASAQAHYLLGLLREATGQPDAIDSYRKALYLEPNHYESLLQMALLLQKNGDVERARAFKTRAQRVKIKT